MNITVALKGNIIGRQAVELRTDDENDNGIAVAYMNNVMYLSQNGKVLEEVDMDDFEGLPKISVEEDRRDTLAGEYGAFARRAGSHNESKAYKKLKAEAEALEARTVAQGAEEYKRTFQISDQGDHKLDITLKGNLITILVDDRIMWDGYELSESEPGAVRLSCAWGDFGYSQRNIADDVYDGVFSEITIKEPDSDVTVYSNEYHGKEKATHSVRDIWNGLINWFIKNL